VDPSGYVYDGFDYTYDDDMTSGGGMPSFGKNGINTLDEWNLAWECWEAELSGNYTFVNEFLRNHPDVGNGVKNNFKGIAKNYGISLNRRYSTNNSYDNDLNGSNFYNDPKTGKVIYLINFLPGVKSTCTLIWEVNVAANGGDPNYWLAKAGAIALTTSAADGPIPIGEAIGATVITIAALHDLIIKGIELTNKRQKHPADDCFVDKGHQYIFPPDPNQDPSGSVPLAELLLLRLIDNWIDAVTPNESETPNNNSDLDNNQLYYYIMPIE